MVVTIGLGTPFPQVIVNSEGTPHKNRFLEHSHTADESDQFHQFFPEMNGGQLCSEAAWSQDEHSVSICVDASSQLKQWPGSGTVNDPYRIENLTLDGGGSGTGISLHGISDYYLVRNCTISNFHIGLSIKETDTCQIRNNAFLNNTQKAINLYNSHNNVLINNTCLATQYWSGIHLEYYSANNSFVSNHLFGCDFHFLSNKPQGVVANNTVDGEPVLYFQDQRDLNITNQSGQILLFNCSNSEIRQNSASISLWYPEQVAITDNNCSLHYCGINVYGGNDVRIQKNTLSNLMTGIETESCDNLLIQNNVITNIDYYAIHVALSENLTLRQNHCSQISGAGIRLEVFGSFELINNYVTHANDGIVLEDRHFYNTYLNVSGNICLNNQYNGIVVYADARLNLWNNTCNYNNDAGISLIGTGPHSLVNNTCYNNGGSGISLLASNGNQVLNNNCTGNDIGIQAWNITYRNVIWMNTFVANRVNAEDNGETNSFQLNYWSDYTGVDGNHDGIGDSPYLIPGEANNYDPLPLLFPPLDTSMLFLIHQRGLFTNSLIMATLSIIVIIEVVVLFILLARRHKFRTISEAQRTDSLK